MDWIHCNKCFSQLTANVSLFITTCGHMYCNNCLGNVEKNTGNCIICRSPCSIVKLEPDMSPDVQDFFTDPEEIIKKVSQVLQFQKQHRKRLLSYLFQSTKKFHQTRSELKRVLEILQKQNNKLKQYEKRIEYLELELGNSSKHISPFTMRTPPAYNNISPNYMSCTPTFKNTAKSTPFSISQSNLVTPCRLTKQRLNTSSSNSQKSNNSHKITSTVLTPPTPESAGYYSQSESGYRSASPFSYLSPGLVYCNGYSKKCAFRNK